MTRQWPMRRMRITAWTLLIFCISGLSMTAAAMETKWGGHIRTQGAISAFDKPHILEWAGNTGPLHDGALDARINASIFSGEHIAGEIHYEAGMSGGEKRELLHDISARFPQAGLFFTSAPSDERRLFSLTRIILKVG